MILIERHAALLAREIEGPQLDSRLTLANLHWTYLMFPEFLSRYLPRHFELLLLLELEYAFLDDVVLALLVKLATLTHRPAYLVESTDDVLCYLEFQFVNVSVVDVLERITYKHLIDTLTQHRTGLNNETHLRLSQELSRRIVLIKQKLTGQIDLIVLVQLTRNLLCRQGLELMLRDKAKATTTLEELSAVELDLETVDVREEQSLVLLAPTIVYLELLVFVHH